MDPASNHDCLDAFDWTVAGVTGLGLALGRGLECSRRGTSTQLATAGLVVMLVCGSAREAPGQTGTVAALALVNGAGLGKVASGFLPTIPSQPSMVAAPSTTAESSMTLAALTPESPVPPVTIPAPSTDPSMRDESSMIHRVRELDALLAVRGGRPGLSARQTDEALAAAVARGTAHELEKRSAFKRHSSDLFRAQRSLQVGNQEMLLRLRLRPKKRDTMSVELRF